MEYEININQTITKAEIDVVEKNFKGVFRFNYYINIILLILQLL